MEPQAVVELPETENGTWEWAIEWAVGWLVAEGWIPPDRQSEVLNCLLRRERLGSTVIRSGVAVPHSRVPMLPKPIHVLFTSSRGVRFQPNSATPDSEVPVHQMHLALHTSDDPADHLRRLQRIVERVLASNPAA